MFYTYRQNNSYGVFDVDDNVKHFVIIEADSAKEANEKAEHIGIYFDGVEKELDCPCCGDRWYKVIEEDGTEKPKIYGEDPSSYLAFRKQLFYGFSTKEKVIVYYKNGKIEVFKEI